MNEDSCCIANILEVIDILQKKSEKFDDIPNTCDRPFLGFSSANNNNVYNTRPIVLYNSVNNAISLPYELVYNGQTISGVSSVLRVEKIDDCCITCRVLAENPDTASVLPYVATDSFCNLNSNCICCLRCLNDTFIDCI